MWNALEYGHVEAIRFLMARGADFRRQDGSGRNVFFGLAAALAKYSLAKPIEVKVIGGKAKEITFHFRDNSWEQLQWEAGDPKKEMAETVTDVGEQRRMIHDLLPQRDRKDELMKIAEELLAVGVRADAVDRKQGTTLLMRAADVNAPVGFIDLMVRHGADVKRQGRLGADRAPLCRPQRARRHRRIPGSRGS